MVTEFVSSEGIIRRDDRTRKYTEFDEDQRPIGVQLFGADGNRMSEAAKKIIDWTKLNGAMPADWMLNNGIVDIKFDSNEAVVMKQRAFSFTKDLK